MTSSTLSAPPRRRRTVVAAWILQLLAAAAFMAAGGFKLAGAPQMVQLFEQVGFGQWLRYVTGGLEMAGAVLLLIPARAAWGGLLLAVVMAGAVFTHLVLIGGSPIPALLLLAVTATVAWLRRESLPFGRRGL